MSSPRVFLIDDNPSYLRAAARLLRLSGFEVKAYESARDFLDELTPTASGCVVTDLDMPQIDGIKLQEQLAVQSCLLPVIFLTGKGDIPTSVRVMRQGAEDFLTKDASKEELINAVHRAFARNGKERRKQSGLSELRRKMASLTPREHEVMQHVVQGKLNKQIAAELGIHERTVKLHRNAVTTKLSVPSVAELTVIWMQVHDFETDVSSLCLP